MVENLVQNLVKHLRCLNDFEMIFKRCLNDFELDFQPCLNDFEMIFSKANFKII